MSTALGSGKKLEEFVMKTEVFDSVGNATFNHPNVGQALDVQVTLIGAGGGGGGGSQDNVGVDAADGTAGGDSIWNTSGTPITALGGGAGLGGKDTTNQGNLHATQSFHVIPRPTGSSGGGTGHSSAFTKDNGTSYGQLGGGGYGSGYSGGVGGIGFIKTFSATITGDINLTIGAGGSGGAKQVGGSSSNSDGQDGRGGAIIVQYAKASAGIPAPIAYQFVEEWIDKDRETADSGVWTHPNPGQAIDMTVIVIGGAGGNRLWNSATVAGNDGGNSTFDSLTALGGIGPPLGSNNTGARVAGGLPGGYNGGNVGTLGFGIFGNMNTQSSVGYATGVEQFVGSSGGVKIGRITVTANVNYSIGAGGTGGETGAGDGFPGGIILKYSK